MKVSGGFTGPSLLLNMRAQGGHTTKLLCKRWVGVAALLLLMGLMLLLRMGLLLLLQRVRILKVVGTRCATTRWIKICCRRTQLGTSDGAESKRVSRFHASVHLDALIRRKLLTRTGNCRFLHALVAEERSSRERERSCEGSCSCPGCWVKLCAESGHAYLETRGILRLDPVRGRVALSRRAWVPANHHYHHRSCQNC
jgi:hypothetical protein